MLGELKRTYNMKIFSYFILISIFILSIIKVPETKAPQFTDKIVHVIMYFFCTFAFFKLKVQNFLGFAILYGIFIEIIQYFLPWRSFSINDIIANLIGSFLFYLFFRKFIKSSH